MNLSLRGLLRQVLVYGSGRIALQLFSFLTLPVLTRIFTPATYGVIETVTTAVAVAGIVATLSLESAIQRSYFDYPEDDVRARMRVLGTGLVAMLAWSSCLTVVLILFSTPISRLMFGTGRYGDIVALAFLAVPLGVVVTYAQEVLRLRHRAGRYVAISLLRTSVTVGLVLLFVAGLDLGVRGLYLAGVVGVLPALLAGVWVARDAFRPAFDRLELRTMLVYALPLMPVAAWTWVTQFADRFFVLHYESTNALGLYALGVRLSNLLMLGVVSFGVAFAPFILELHSRSAEAERVMRARTLTYVVAGLSFAGIAVTVYARDVFRTLTDPSFEQAYQVVGLLCAGVLALGVNGVTMTGISLSRRTGYFARYGLYAAAANIVLNVALIPPFGIVGAALATAVTYGYLAVLYWFRAQRLDHAPFETQRVVTLLVLAAGLAAIGTAIDVDPVWLSVLAKTPLVLAFPVLAWLLGALDSRLVSFLRLPAQRGEVSA